MILYTLRCDEGHAFESWFRSAAAYDDQTAQGLVGCPACGSSRVVKAIMAPAVVGARTQPGPPPDLALTNHAERRLQALLRIIRDKVVSSGEDVGERFAIEARRIHDGETPDRRIYGRASFEEACELLEDGIVVQPLPTFPDELN